ncbi:MULTISPECIES: preprotein translocase subunit SecA [Anaerostipes]|uniref:Protein translocase subunit SecA n=1 Tax=Anaerostipes butyraticus TaxID=645466 RepID=A0A916VEE3_9FIRM|nr:MULTISPECIES: preprotein translocase subunit SecA [Anaerostipes]GFO85807.1 protein translocase subunit SecA [Anaerostipes butyraticus]HJC82821.1 preprotein translocase subunit SecA [Candidatus Anaerostipes avicola]
MSLLDKVFGSHSDKEIKRISKTVDKIEALDEEMQKLSDEELKHKTKEFKERLEMGENLDDLLPEAFAVVREASSRTIGMKHYRVQLIGGIILHQGRIAEMRTGEGKTLVATLPAYLNALEGKGVHIVTVNDYLATRDAQWMGQVHNFLGLSVGVVTNDMNNDARRAAYQCDITYITNNELGFDYLRDNMVIDKKDLVQRDLHYAIVDEVDSVLIDEARTPLIISGQSNKSTELYRACDILARKMERGSSDGELSKMDILMNEDIEEDGDFLVNEKDKQIMLTAEGVKKVEDFFHIENLADPDNLAIQHNIILALRAHNLMFKDKDYVVKDDEVLIVDEFTGRIMPGRRYSDGLHQAIEAKEHVKVKRESKTLATITFQNFFNKYSKKAGMTGTAQTEEQEFREIYGMDVVVIPTNKPVIRVDHNDAIYKTKREKMNAVVNDIIESHKKGQPVLVGTITIETSEELSRMLKKRNIKHSVLNAKFHEKEAEIVSHAGEIGAVTIATNMAGRGTDIVLEEGVAELGGLKIIGTERHESRRIDNQLRGRAGRQGDPGESKFYLSLEDDLMRLFGSERMIAVYNALGIPEGEEIQHKSISRTIEKAQKKIENNNFGIRKNLLDYDRVNNDQREVIYKERRRVLDGDNMKQSVLKMMKDTVENRVRQVISNELSPDEWDMAALNAELLPIIPLQKIELTEEERKSKKVEKLIERLQQEAVDLYEQKEKEFEGFDLREIERIILLKVIDRKWMDHIDDMDQLREGIGMQAYGQRDPVVEYRLVGFDMFNDMIKSIEEETAGALFHVQIEQKIEREEAPKITGTNKDIDGPRTPYVRKGAKVGRNDPCPCGSGKKYKNCCGKNKK